MFTRFPALLALILGLFLAACSGGGSSTSPQTPLPAAPSGLSASASSATTVSLAWTGASSITSYKIYRNGVEIATTTTGSFTDTGLTASTSYSYSVRGVSAAGLTNPSATVSVTTPSATGSSDLVRLLDPASRSYMMVRDTEIDAAGNIFIAGGAFSGSFPTTAGAYDRTFGSGGTSTGSVGPSDAFVMKFNRAGQLQWSTLVGGPNHDRAYALEIAPDGGLVIAGRAGEGFPTTAGVLQPAFGGQVEALGAYGKQDGFVAKISADGSRLLWSTYIGDQHQGILRDVAVDANNKIYVTGFADGGFPHITPNAAQGVVRGAHDLVYVRLSANARTLEYGTFLGGVEPNGEVGGTPSIVVTPSRDVYVAIEEGGTGAPTTPNAFRRNGAGGVDLLIGRFSPADQLVYGTYLGGSSDEDLETHNIGVNAAGQLGIAGFTASTNFPVTSGAYQSANNGGASDAFVALLSADGSQLVASTYFGGAAREDVEGFEFSSTGQIYFAGSTRSSSLRTTTNAFQRNFAGVSDGFLAIMAADLKSASYLSYFGGSDSDGVRAMDLASDGSVALGGPTASPQFPINGGGTTAPNGGAVTGWWALITP